VGDGVGVPQPPPARHDASEHATVFIHLLLPRQSEIA
jgi:hypothetical protein